MAVVAAVGVSAGCAPRAAGVAAPAPRPFPGAPAPAAPDAPDVSLGASDHASLAAGVLDTALGLRGIPYRLGGDDLTGFDCSGFVQYVLARHAVPMPRTVAQQFKVGQKARDIEPGDLVFFQTIGSKASHVGIAVDEFSFVHAPNSRGVVRIDRLDAPYWAGRFLGARRVY